MAQSLCIYIYVYQTAQGTVQQARVNKQQRKIINSVLHQLLIFLTLVFVETYKSRSYISFPVLTFLNILLHIHIFLCPLIDCFGIRSTIYYSKTCFFVFVMFHPFLLLKITIISYSRMNFFILIVFWSLPPTILIVVFIELITQILKVGFKHEFMFLWNLIQNFNFYINVLKQTFYVVNF